MRRTIPLVVLLLTALTGRGDAQPYGKPAPPQQVWDSRGWVLLGERTVNGRVDRDTIEVGRYEGRFSKLTLVVTDSDLELIGFKIAFADRTHYEPKLAHFFREGQRTRAIDLPPSEQIIRSIDIQYRNLPGGGRAKVQVWGWKVAAADRPPPPPPPPAQVWDSRGWDMLGEREVNGRVDRDTIQVGRHEGRFSKLTVVVLDSDLELVDMVVRFQRGAPWRPEVRHNFREGQRTRVLDFPGDDRTIRTIDLVYRNLPGGGRARVQVWGLKAQAPVVTNPVWDTRGWELLGEDEVNGRFDRDTIRVGRHEGRFDKLNIVVLDSDLELLDFVVRFQRGAPWRPDVRHYFREGQRTRALDLPGDARTIRTIDLRYRNLARDGRAKVQVWGFRSGAPAPVWDSRGWTMLGERAVDGRVDRDRIDVGRDEGKFRKLMIVVLDSDLEMIDFAVAFRRGDDYRPDVKTYFRENTRTRAIDLPGDSRVIRHIEFQYRNLPGGGRARVQVWAQ